LARQFPGAVPHEILESAQGVAILSEVKLAFGIISYKLGTGTQPYVLPFERKLMDM